MQSRNLSRLFTIVGPGILVAATGVGAGDLATASFTGNSLGLAILWAVLLGAFLKFVLNEGLARWQLATGKTLLEGCVDRFGRPLRWLFLAYLVIWSFLVGAALMSAIGVASHAIFPIFGAEASGANKIFYGILHSFLALALVSWGGYKLFGRVMSVCIGMMFVVVIVTAVSLRPPLDELAAGLVTPVIPSGGVLWTVALLGGIGGTMTILCYGYWIREEGRTNIDTDMKTCRLDLATGYAVTAVFGIAMVIIGNSLGPLPSGGATLIVDIVTQFEARLGAFGGIAKWAFLIGAWGAMFSSLLGVWQSMPYLFADFWNLSTRKEGDETLRPVNTKSLPYRAYLWGIAVVPTVGLVALDFKTMQMVFAVVGALCIPLLAAILLYLNGRASLVGKRHTNSRLTSAVLVAALLFFVFAGTLQIWTTFRGTPTPAPEVASGTTKS